MLRKCFRTWREFVFPPHCVYCGERCDTKIFCFGCWQLCQPPDPADRCSHCFSEEGIDERNEVCRVCKRQALLYVKRAYVFERGAPVGRLEDVKSFASFAVLQWIQLEWPCPDALVPMPDRDSVAFAKAFGHFIDRPVVRALKMGSCGLREDSLGEKMDLLILDAGNGAERLKRGTAAVLESFPKSCYLLSLFHDSIDSFVD